MPGKARAGNPAITVPKRNHVQKMAEAYGYTRVLVNGSPMITKKAAPAADVFANPKRRAKVIGPTKYARVGAVRG